MTAEEFLSDLARQNLVPGEIIESLRRQVAKSAKPVAPQTLVKLLVDKGHLTAIQGQKMLGTTAPNSAPPPLPAAKKPAPAALEPLGPIDDLGLAPLDDLLTPLPPEPAAPAKPATAPAKPAAKPAAPSPAKSVAPPKSPAASAPAAKAKAPAPVQELQPLDDLEPLDEAVTLDLSSSGDLFGAPAPAGGFGAATADPFAPASSATTAVADPFAQPVALTSAAAAPAPPAKKSSGLLGLVIGLVVVLLIAGGTAAAFFLIPRETGEKDFAAAEQDYQAKQYRAAMEKYDAALARYPYSPQAGLAKVHHALAKILTASSSPTDWPRVLPVAKEVLPPIAAQPELAQVHDQLAPLLMDMADGLATLAAKAKTADEAATRIAQAKDALALTSDARLVPGSLRQWQRLASAEETLAVLDYSARRPSALEAALNKINQAAGNDAASAYAERARLVLEYPDLSASPALQGAMQQVAQAEARNVKPLADASAAETTEDQPAIVSGQASAAPAAATGRTFVALASGSALAFDGQAGQLLWRRPARGEALASVPVSAEAGSDMLLVDDAQLLRVNSKTGALIWRRQCPSPLAGGPIVSGAKLLVATRGGQVFRLDAASGAIDAAVQLPLPCRVPPAISADGSRVYQLAEHSLLFSLAAADLACDTAIYLGHEPASVVAPPLPIGQHLVIGDNAGAADAVLQVIGLKEDGQPQGIVQRVGVPGHVLTPPLLLGKHLVALTDRGSSVALRITAEKSTPLELLAEPHADAASGAVPFGLAVGEKLLVAGNGLRLEALDAASGNFAPTWTAFANETLLAPPQLAGDVLFCVRRDPANTGAVAAAVQASTGKPLWQTPMTAESTAPTATLPPEGAARP
jgi:hypothetical protein